MLLKIKMREYVLRYSASYTYVNVITIIKKCSSGGEMAASDMLQMLKFWSQYSGYFAFLVRYLCLKITFLQRLHFMHTLMNHE